LKTIRSLTVHGGIMRTQLARVVSILAFAAAFLTATAASAQRVYVEDDYARLRAGVDLGAGGIFLNGFGLGLVGIDGRLGAQINHLFGIYAQAHLAFGGGSCGPGGCVSGLPGLFSLSAVGDFTFNRFFIGGGAGFVYLGEDPHASPEVLFRIGFYPLMQRTRWGRRRGLRVGVDLHLDYIVGGGDSVALLQPMGVIGFEAF
jgi:hypothetical protein